MTSVVAEGVAQGVVARARKSLGSSEAAIYEMVARAIRERETGSEVIVDVGCGVGHLHEYLGGRFARYVGVDAVSYESFPDSAELLLVDLDSGSIPLADESADVVTAVEIIEHLENPRALMRELVRLVKPGGIVIVTTPNQLSLLSLLTLVVKKRFNAFQDVHYPAHLTALLEIDLKRIASECGLKDIRIEYSLEGRLVLTPWHYPRFLSRLLPGTLSDNLLFSGRK